MESESQAVETTSLLTKQPSEIDETNSNSITTTTNSSTNTSSYGDSNSSSSNGEKDSFLSTPDEETLEKTVVVAGIGDPVSGSLSGLPARKANVPIAKVSADEEEEDDDGENEVGGEEEEVGVVGAIENAPPRVRVSGEEDLEEEEDNTDGDGVSGVSNGPLSSKIEQNGAFEEGDAIVDSIIVDVGEALRSGAAVVGVEKGEDDDGKPVGEDIIVEESIASEAVESEGVKSTSEEKSVEGSSSVVDVIKPVTPSAVEGLEEKEGSEIDSDEGKSSNEDNSVEGSSGVGVVGPVTPSADEGLEEEKKGLEIEPDAVKSCDEENSVEGSSSVDVIEPVTPSVDESLEEKKGSEVELGDNETTVVEEESAVEDSAVVEAEGLKLTEEGDSIVDSISIDASEAIRSRAAVVGEVAEKEDSGNTAPEAEKSGVEEAGLVTENSIAEESAPVGPMATESDGVKVIGEEDDALVEGVYVDAVEAVRSGVAVVGDSRVEEKESEVKEIGASVEENVDLGNEFEPLGGTDSSGLSPNLDNHVESLKNDESDEHQESNGVTEDDGQEVSASEITAGHQKVGQTEEIGVEAEEEERDDVVEADGGEDSDTDGESKDVYTSRMIEELERASRGVDQSERNDGVEVVTDSEEEGASDDEEGEEKELFDSAALAALLKAASSAGGSDPGTITITSPDGSRLFSVERPAGLGSSLRSVRPATRSANSSYLTPPNLAAPSEENLSEEEKKKLQHIHDLRVKFLRLVHRLAHSAEDSIAAQVLYRLALLAGRPTTPAYSLDNAKRTAMQLEDEGKDDLNFSLNILVLGKAGVGKSATINSIFGEEKVKINAFEAETTSVQVVDGMVEGVKIRVIDAPGLKCSGIEQGFNRKVLTSVKKYMKKYPPDVMLYVDRLDSPARGLNDLPMLKTITSCLGTSIWRSAVVALTHASSAPPEGPSGSPLSYEVFVAQRSHIVQQSIGHATGDMRLMNPSLMNPISLVENHPACRKNREGQRVLPNGQTWRPQLLLLCYSLKILSEASLASKPQDSFDHRKLFGFRARSPPLPYLLSSLLQPHAHPKLSAEQGGDNVDSDIDLDDLSDSDREEEEEEDEYDQLPPFKPLRKSQIAKLSKEQRKAYFEEYDYRVKLLQKKQWKEELKRMREMKKNGGKMGVDEYGEMPEDFDGENGTPAAVPVPLPDMTLPPSFDSDNPAYRYRFLEPTSQFLARPVLDTHGWDHDCGYDGVNVEQNLGIAGKFPAAITVQVTKDKKDFNIHLDSALSAKHGETGSSLVGFDIQTIGKQLAYIVRGESKFKNLKKNRTAAGVSVTFLGENVATGVKLEDQISVGKRLVLVGSTGTVRSQKDAAYGANLEVRLREADFPIGQDQSSFVLSLMKWRGDLAIGGNLQSQFSVGRGSKMAVRVGLNNKLSGQISVRISSSDHVQLALAGLIPIAISIYRTLKPGASENYSLY